MGIVGFGGVYGNAAAVDDEAGQRAAGNEIVTSVLSAAPPIQKILGRALEEAVPVSVAALVLRALHAAVEESKASAEIGVEAITREIQQMDIVDPAIAHPFEVDTGAVRAAGAWVDVVVEGHREPRDSRVLMHLAVGEPYMDRIVGGVESSGDRSIERNAMAALANHSPEVAERENRMVKGRI